MNSDIVPPPKPDNQTSATPPPQSKGPISDFTVAPAPVPASTFENKAAPAQELATPEAQPTAEYLPADLPQQKTKKSSNRLVITCAVIFFVSLSGIAVYTQAFSDEKNPTVSKQSSQELSSSADQVPKNTVDANEQKEINSVITEAENLPSDDDSSAKDLSDQSLGL